MPIPATLSWLGSVHGHRVRPLGVEHFGQTGTLADLYRHYGIDTAAIIAAAEALDSRQTDPAFARHGDVADKKRAPLSRGPSLGGNLERSRECEAPRSEENP